MTDNNIYCSNLPRRTPCVKEKDEAFEIAEVDIGYDEERIMS